MLPLESFKNETSFKISDPKEINNGDKAEPEFQLTDIVMISRHFHIFILKYYFPLGPY